MQRGAANPWTIAQKQTGANALALGGAMAANVHGRGLRMKPLIGDIESFRLVDADGELKHCSRSENAELFRLAIGGYGLFGVIATLTLRLAPRQKLRRVVEVIDIDRLMPSFERRIAGGFLYGDFQFMTDPASEQFLRRGVFSCYQPVPIETEIPDNPRHLSEEDWKSLLHLAHVDKANAFRLYAEHYLATSGQVYWSDLHQLAVYLDDYHLELDEKLGASCPATEMITELFVPRQALAAFLHEAGQEFREHDVNLIYGTVRLAERDDESYLAWARQPYAGIIFNLHVEHSGDGKRRAAAAFRRLIDRAIAHDGSFYLTYHRFATRRQIDACYPQFRSFLELKRRYDPEERFQSEWYRHYRAMYAD